MARAVWDQATDREYRNGVSKVMLYVMNNGTYGTGVPWSGVTAITENPGGAEETKIWADNIQYGSLWSAETYGYTLECYTWPKEFDACDGLLEVADGVYIGQQTRAAFGACWRTEIGDANDPDKGYQITVAYGGRSGPASKNNNTKNDSPEATTFSREVSCTPISMDGVKPVVTITFLSTAMAADKLKLLEDKLYGTDGEGNDSGTEPTLPSLSELIALVGGSVGA